MATTTRGRLRPKLIPSDDYTAEVAVALSEAILMCLAEAGYPRTFEQDDSLWENGGRDIGWLRGGRVPQEILERAQMLACDQLGVAYEMVEA